MRRTFIILLVGICTVISTVGCENPRRFDANSRAASFDLLWQVLTEHYAYLEVSDEWLATRETYRKAVVHAPNEMAYFTALAQMLSQLDDPHVSLTVTEAFVRQLPKHAWTSAVSASFTLGGRTWIRFSDPLETSPTTQALFAGQFNEVITVNRVTAPGLLLTMLEGEPGHALDVTIVDIDGNERHVDLICPESVSKKSPPATQSLRSGSARYQVPESQPTSDGRVFSFKSPSNIGFISIFTFNDAAVVQQFDRALDRLKDTRALVLDVRVNAGGTVENCNAVLSRFMSGTKACGRITYRRRLRYANGAFPVWYEPYWRVTGRAPIYHRPLVVLIDTGTASAAEMFAFALQDVCGAYLIGHRTAGAGAGIATFELPEGIEVQFSMFPVHRLDGRSIERVGVAPDLEIPYSRRQMFINPSEEVRKWASLGAEMASMKAEELANRY